MPTSNALGKDVGSGSAQLALALSGGGSRAMAFHLGCLRALNDLGVLQRVSTITSVSGGSVVGALYCSEPGDFDAFERRVRQVLAQGFVASGIRGFVSKEGLNALLISVSLLIERTVAFAARGLLKLFKIRIDQGSWPNISPILRVSSRTTILRNAFSKMYRGLKLTDLRMDRPKLVVIACELRAKAAFYFTAEKLHCWKYGAASSEGVEIAEAVSASAAYPAALPAIDKRMVFHKGGVASTHRVTLTDGGVYDNLGLAPLWPHRDSSISLDVGSVERIIACRAGYALSIGDPSTFWPSRMGAAFESVFARSQNFATTRLHDLARSKELKGFLLPYLGQQDEKLKFPPEGLVTRSEADGYPTDFFAMDEEWVRRLSKRGEQLVHALVRENWPDYQMDLPLYTCPR